MTIRNNENRTEMQNKKEKVIKKWLLVFLIAIFKCICILPSCKNLILEIKMVAPRNWLHFP